jgi:hypothetical protein
MSFGHGGQTLTSKSCAGYNTISNQSVARVHDLNCRVSDLTVGLPRHSHNRIDAGLPALPGTIKPNSGRFGAGLDGWFGGVRLLPSGTAGAGGVD